MGLICSRSDCCFRLILAMHSFIIISFLCGKRNSTGTLRKVYFPSSPIPVRNSPKRGMLVLPSKAVFPEAEGTAQHHRLFQEYPHGLLSLCIFNF